MLFVSQLCSRTAQTRGDGAGGGLWQRHNLLQRHRGLHIHVCGEHAAAGTRDQYLIAKLVFVFFLTAFKHRLLLFLTSELIWKLFRNQWSWSQSQWVLPFLLVHGRAHRVSIYAVSHSVPTQLKIVQLLDGRVCLTQSWVTLCHHVSPSHLNTKVVSRLHVDEGLRLLMDNLTLCAELESTWGRKCASFKMCGRIGHALWQGQKKKPCRFIFHSRSLDLSQWRKHRRFNCGCKMTIKLFFCGPYRGREVSGGYINHMHNLKDKGR